MKKIIAAAFVLAVSAVCCEQATAQVRSRNGAPTMRRSGKPVTSPYLNLLNRNGANSSSGGGVGFNYFQRVKPEQEFRQADSQLQQGLTSVQKQVNTQQQMLLKQSSSSQLTQSGHMTSFFSTGNFYPTKNR